MPVRRSLDQQRDKALRRALGTGRAPREVSNATLRRAMAAFEVRRQSPAPMTEAIDTTLRQYPDAHQVRAPRLPGAGRARTAMWVSLGAVCELCAAFLLVHHASAAWCASFASFGLAAALYGITQWQTVPVSSLPQGDRDDWRRAGQRYDQAWAAIHAQDLSDAVHQRLDALQATLMRLIPLALNPLSQAWSLQERVSLESTIGDYLPDAIHAYLALPQVTDEGLASFERQLDSLQTRLTTQETAVVQRGHQRLRVHERFLRASDEPEQHL